MIDIYDFYKKMQHNNIMLSFKGEITSDLLTSILQIMESKLDRMQEEPKIKKKVFNVLVECLQNLYHHIDEIKTAPTGVPVEVSLQPNEMSGNGTNESKAVILMIGKESNNYYIFTGNHILNEKVELLKYRLDKINSLSKDELKALYQEILNNEEFSNKGGGGLGIIDIVRKSGQKLAYNFQKINERHSFFSLHIKIVQ